MVLSTAASTISPTMLSTKLYYNVFSKRQLILLCSGIVLLASCSKESASTPTIVPKTTDVEVVSTTSVDTTDAGKEVASLFAKTLVNVRLTLSSTSAQPQENITVAPSAILTFDSKGNSETKLIRSSTTVDVFEYTSILLIDESVYSQVDVGVPGGPKSTKWVMTKRPQNAANGVPAVADPLALLTAGSTTSTDCFKTASYKETKAGTWEIMCTPTMKFPLVVSLKEDNIEYIQYSGSKLSYEFLKNVEMFTPPQDILEGSSAEKELMSESISGFVGYIGYTIIAAAQKMAASPAEISVQNLSDAAKELLTVTDNPLGPDAVLEVYPSGEVVATLNQGVLTVSHTKYKVSCSSTIELRDAAFTMSTPVCVG